MREYPRWVSRGKDDKLLVTTEEEETAAASKGYESHWNPEIVEKRKGTDREILRSAEPQSDTLSPQQKAAITRKKNKELKDNG